MIKFPYGMSDFYVISTEGYFYIDRTDRIPLIEEAGKQLLFLRPRRFGKSMLLSMLENYYDLARADQFEPIFGDLAIGKNPTPLHNCYFVLKWDFSNITTIGDAEDLAQRVYDHINAQIDGFVAHYEKYLARPITIHPQNALSSLASLLAAVSQTPYKLYLLIDEYDNFANEVLMSNRHEGQKRYEELVKGEGFLKTIFKALKSAAGGQGLDRVFITGVSPLVMSDMSSGYNVAEDIHLLPEFADLCGFHEHEVSAIVAQVSKVCQFSAEKEAEILATMRTFYNGYRFHTAQTAGLYNPTLTLYFCKALQRTCAYPQEMLDHNMALDHTRLAYIASLGGAEQLVLAALNEPEPLVTPRLMQRFGVSDLMSSSPKSNTYLSAILYYLGMLTLGGTTPLQAYILPIPNLVTRQLYLERLRELLLPDRRVDDEILRLTTAFFLRGDLQSLCEFVEQRLLTAFDNRDYLAANELTIKTAFLTLLFNDQVYIIDSETAIRRTYADLTLMLRPDLRQRQALRDFILEFKYLKLGDVKIDNPKADGEKPSQRPLDGLTARQMSQAELRALPEVQAQLAQARTQLQSYRRDLQVAYQGGLRLQTYAIVALGFDRLVWEEILP